MDIWHQVSLGILLQVECVVGQPTCHEKLQARTTGHLSRLLNIHTMKVHGRYQGSFHLTEVQVKVESYWTMCCRGTYTATSQRQLIANIYRHRRTSHHRERRSFEEWKSSREPDRLIELGEPDQATLTRIRLGLPDILPAAPNPANENEPKEEGVLVEKPPIKLRRAGRVVLTEKGIEEARRLGVLPPQQQGTWRTQTESLP